MADIVHVRTSKTSGNKIYSVTTPIELVASKKKKGSFTVVNTRITSGKQQYILNGTLTPLNK